MEKKNSILNITLWFTQGLLALTLLWAGTMKLLKPSELPWPWIAENPNLVKATGILDLLAGIGIIVPSLLNIQSKWTIYASYGTIALMIGAGAFHISRGEASQIGFNIFVMLIALFIVLGRNKKAPIK